MYLGPKIFGHTGFLYKQFVSFLFHTLFPKITKKKVKKLLSLEKWGALAPSMPPPPPPWGCACMLPHFVSVFYFATNSLMSTYAKGLLLIPDFF